MMKQENESPTALAWDLLDALHEAAIAADFYVVKANKTPYVNRFIEHMYRVEELGNQLRSAMNREGQQFRTIHNRPVKGFSSSVHDHLAAIASFLTSDVFDGLMDAWLHESKSSQPHGEIVIALPNITDFQRYIDPAIAAFRRNPESKRLNGWAARLEQEIAQTEANKEKPGTADDKPNWSAPEKMLVWAKRFDATDRSLREWRKAGTLRMEPVAGRRGLWHVDESDPLYIQWSAKRKSLAE